MDPGAGGRGKEGHEVNQGDLARAIAEKFSLGLADSKAIVDFTLSTVQGSLKAGERVYFRGFGSFTKKITPGRRVRHPKTGEIIWIPARAYVDLNPSRSLLKALK